MSNYEVCIILYNKLTDVAGDSDGTPVTHVNG